MGKPRVRARGLHDSQRNHSYCRRDALRGQMLFLPLNTMNPTSIQLACLLVSVCASSAQATFPNTEQTWREDLIVAAANAGAAPQFNGAHVIGLRPNTPLIYALNVSGARPMEFSVKNLPPGLALNAKSGIISGTLIGNGNIIFKACAKNNAGKASTKIEIVCGTTLALTPPMGWNSYDAFGDNVAESEVMSNAHYVAEKMLPVGWDTIVVDYCWSDLARMTTIAMPVPTRHWQWTNTAGCCPHRIVFPRLLTARGSSRLLKQCMPWA